MLYKKIKIINEIKFYRLDKTKIKNKKHYACHFCGWCLREECTAPSSIKDACFSNRLYIPLLRNNAI